MYTIDRTTVLKGPCIVTANSVPFYHQNAVTIKPVMKKVTLKNSRFGSYGRRLMDNYHQIIFQPDSQLSAAILTALCSYGSLFPGASLFGANDQTLTVQSVDGRLYTAQNAALSVPPSLTFSNSKPLWGQATFTAIRSKNTAFSAANSLYTLTSNAYPGDAGFVEPPVLGPWSASWASVVPGGTGTVTATGASPDVFHLVAHGYVAGDTVVQSGFANVALNGTFTVHTVPDADHYSLYLYGTTTPVNGSGSAETGGSVTRKNPFDDFETEGGFEITPRLSLQPKETDNGGLYDMWVTDLEMSLKAKPVGNMSESDIFTAINASGLVRGGDVAALGQNLRLAGVGGLYFWLYQSEIDDSALKYDSVTDRIDTLTWVATRSITGGVANPLFKISTTPIAS